MRHVSAKAACGLALALWMVADTGAAAHERMSQLGADRSPSMPESAQFSPDSRPDPALVLGVVERAANAQTALFRDNVASGRPVSSNWISATFFVGLAKLARVSDDPDHYAYMQRTADEFHHALRGPGTAVALLNADDQAIGDLYEELYARRRLPGLLMPLQQRLDFNIPYLQRTPEPDKLVWWWCDSLFMAPPVLARMSALTGDPRYLQAMDVQWWRTYEALWDPEEQLYFRDERFISRRSATGKKIFWSRGNGWVMAGLARVLESMPADFPTRPRYEALFRQMAARIITLQGSDGLWRTSLLDTAHLPDPETSGTAFYAYALAFGVNHGLLEREVYEPHVWQAWAGLNRYVLSDGMLGMVQSAGDQPVPTRPETTAPYASGGLILAGLEIMKLGLPSSPLPVVEPVRDEWVTIPSDMGPNRPATNAAQAEENRRRDAERQAMIDHPFDPAIDDPDYSPPELPTRSQQRE